MGSIAASNLWEMLIDELRSGVLLFSRPSDIFLMIIDVFFTSVIIFYILRLLSETRAWQVMKGLILILLLTQGAKTIGLQGFSFLIGSSISLLAFGFVVIFQPELRKALETVGRNSLNLFQTGGFNRQEYSGKIQSFIEQIVIACDHMAATFTGALIIVERRTKLGEILEQGQSVILNSDISSTALEQIFYKGSPMHDGALLLRDGKIYAARCHVPLSDNYILRKEHGTRHRAAIGASEIGDAVGIVVSEERGKISIAIDGRLYLLENADALRTILHKLLISDENQEQSRNFKSVLYLLRNFLLGSMGSEKKSAPIRSDGLMPEAEEPRGKSKIKDFRRSLLLRLTSVTIAFLLWFYAQASSNPISQKSYSVNFSIRSVEVLDDYDLRYSKENINSIIVYIRGRERFLSNISSDRILAYIDFKDLSKKELEKAQKDTQSPLNMTVHVEIENESPAYYNVVSRSPSSIKINLFNTKKQSVIVEGEGNNPLPSIPLFTLSPAHRNSDAATFSPSEEESKFNDADILSSSAPENNEEEKNGERRDSDEKATKDGDDR